MNDDLEKYLHWNIPLSAAMGVRVVEASDDRVILSAPISPNINHKQTVFGGSLHAVATLACWSWLHVRLKGEGQIVIARSEVDYLAPVVEDFQAMCQGPDGAAWERFERMLAKKGKARIQLSAKIMRDENVFVEFSGEFATFVK